MTDYGDYIRKVYADPSPRLSPAEKDLRTAGQIWIEMAQRLVAAEKRIESLETRLSELDEQLRSSGES